MSKTITEFVCPMCDDRFKKRQMFDRHINKKSNCVITKLIKKDDNNLFCCYGINCNYKSKISSNVRKHAEFCMKVTEELKLKIENGISKKVDDEGQFKSVINKRKHNEEFISHLFSSTLKDVDNGKMLPFIEFTFSVCLDKPMYGTKKIIRSILFNKIYIENINKHLESKSNKKMIVYRGNNNKDVIRTTGQETDEIINDIINNVVTIINKMKVKLCDKDEDNEKEYLQKYYKYLNFIEKNHTKLVDEIYTLFKNKKTFTQKHFMDDYRHLIKVTK